MRIALFNQFFWPDQAATSQLLTDLVRGLVARGHEVIVVCGASGYAGVGTDSRPAVTILSTPGLPFSRGSTGRLASYLSYLAGAAWRTVRLGRVDVIVTMTTPPYLSLLGNLAKRLQGAYHVVWEMDVYPEIATDVGVLSADSLLAKVLAAVAHRSRNCADTVWVLGDCMRRRVIEAGCRPERVQVHENWSYRDLYMGAVHTVPAHLRLIYSGNLGHPHDVMTLQAALLELRDDPRIVVQIAGGGSKRASLEAFTRAEGLSNVEFLPYCSKQDLGRVLSAADVGLVTLRKGCEGAVVPSKVYGLLACGRPILFVGSAQATPAAIVRRFNCGWQVDCGDVNGLSGTLRMLVDRPDLVQEAGVRAHAAFLEHYDVDRSVKRLCRALENCVAETLSPTISPEC